MFRGDRAAVVRGILPVMNCPRNSDDRNSDDDEHAPGAREMRGRRQRAVRARTISVKRLSKRELEEGRELFPEVSTARPKTRGECIGVPRPCPHVSCAHHLYLDVSLTTGSIKLNFPDLEVWEMGESCALDVAARGGVCLEDVGSILNMTRERVRQIELIALRRLERERATETLAEFADDGPRQRPRLGTV